MIWMQDLDSKTGEKQNNMRLMMGERNHNAKERIGRVLHIDSKNRYHNIMRHCNALMYKKM